MTVGVHGLHGCSVKASGGRVCWRLLTLCCLLQGCAVVVCLLLRQCARCYAEGGVRQGSLVCMQPERH